MQRKKAYTERGRRKFQQCTQNTVSLAFFENRMFLLRLCTDLQEICSSLAYFRIRKIEGYLKLSSLKKSIAAKFYSTLTI